MPAINVQRRTSRSIVPSTRGTQYLDSGTLTLGNPTNVVLNGGVYNAPGYYTLFDWSGGGTYNGDTTALGYLSFSWVSKPASIGSGLLKIYDAPNKRIIIGLQPDPTLGCQYVEGNLTIPSSGLMSHIMSAALYPTEGTYVLFDVTGTITGNPANIKCYPQATGLYAGVPFLSGSQIKVTLSAA